MARRAQRICYPVKSSTSLSMGARRLLSAAQDAERRTILRNVYKRYWAADAAGEVDEKKRLSESGELFADHFDLFRSRSEYHKELLTDPAYAKKLPKAKASRPYRIGRRLAEALTASSCHLEGNTLTVADVHALDIAPPTAQDGLPSPVTLTGRGLTSPEIEEVYFHVLALYYLQAATQHRPHFYVDEAEFRQMHRVLLHAVPHKSPGNYRQMPIQVKGHPKACFPFHSELRGLMPRFFEWLRAPDDSTLHPFLRACDIFLVVAHLHPFNDGNGRSARLLASFAMAHGGCQPTVFHGVDRVDYLQAVYLAQHEGRVVDFYRFCLDHHDRLADCAMASE